MWHVAACGMWHVARGTWHGHAHRADGGAPPLGRQASERQQAEAELTQQHAAAMSLKEQQLEGLRDEKARRRKEERTRTLSPTPTQAGVRKEKAAHAHPMRVCTRVHPSGPCMCTACVPCQARLRKENSALDEELGRWMDENEMLRDKVTALERGGGGGGGGGVASAQPSASALLPPSGASEAAALRGKVKELQGKLKSASKDRERVESDKLAIFTEMNEAVQKLEAELKAERARTKKLGRMHDGACADLALAQAQILRLEQRAGPPQQ